MKKILTFLLLCSSLVIQAATYYVATAGNNTNDGLSTITPWQTCARVESQTLLPGDSVLFKAGDVWREILDLNESGTPGNYIYYGRYGTGDNPRFLGSNKAITWTATATPNVWQSATSLTNTSDDYYAGRLFFLTNDSVTWGVYRAYVNLSELTQEFDYTVNGTTHYVYSTTDPDTRYDSIEVTQREQCISLHFNNYLEFNGVDIKFGQRQGVYEGYPVPRGTTDLIFRNCTVGYIGSQGSGAAYGLATFYNNLLVENCFFSDCGRRAVSVNTYTDWVDGRRIENIIIRNNTFKRGYHTTSLDLSTMNRTGDTVMNVYFYNNIIDDSERPTSTPTSNQLFTQGGIGTSRMSNIYIVGNVFIQSTATVMNLENSITHYIWNNTIIALNPSKTTSPYGTIALNGTDTIDLRNNILYDNIPNNALENNLVHGYPTPDVYFSNRDYNLYYTLYPKTDRNFTSVNIGGTRTFWTTNQWSAFKAAFPAWEQHSPYPQNPNFVDYYAHDLRLADNSAAIRSGVVTPYIIITDPSGVVDTINKYDLDGVERSRLAPSIGAYEYAATNRLSRNQYVTNVYSSSGTALSAFDDDFTTYCSATGTNSWIMLKLSGSIRIDNLAIAYSSGASRTYYLQIQISNDSVDWETVLSDTSSGTTANLETFFFNEVSAQYIRVNGLGYNGGTGNLWTEVYVTPLHSTIESSINTNENFRVLFLGNSFTDYGPLTGIFQNIVSSHGWPTPYVRQSILSGQGLAAHRTNSTSMSYINQGNWDYIVLQDLSTRAFTDSLGMKNDFLWFYDTIKVTSPNAKVVGYETWATLIPTSLQDTWYSNQSSTLLSQWDSLQAIIRKSYRNSMTYITEYAESSVKNDTILSQVGDRWQDHFHSDTVFRLHLTNDIHPNAAGCYLNALTMYNEIYKTDVTGAGIWSITDFQGEHLQSLVDSSFEYVEQPTYSSEASILSFSLPNQITSFIQESTNSITVYMPYGSDVTNIAPLIYSSPGSQVYPTSGTSVNLSIPFVYTVTAEDGVTVRIWTVTVNIATQTTTRPLLLPDRSTLLLPDNSVLLITN